MKKFLIAAAGLSAIAAATPAAAQYYPGQPAPYGNAYGYNYGNQGTTRAYLIRADRLISQVERQISSGRLNPQEAYQLRNAARDLHGRTRSFAQNGINNRERYELDQRFAQIEQSLRYAANNNGGRYGQYGQVRDRDYDGIRDGRDGWVDANRNGIDDRREGYPYRR
jgi:hypothetical protein